MAHLWLRSNWNLWSTNSSSFLQPRVRFQQLDCSNEARFAWCKGHIIAALQIEGICSWPTTRTRILLDQLAKVEVMGRSSTLETWVKSVRCLRGICMYDIDTSSFLWDPILFQDWEKPFDFQTTALESVRMFTAPSYATAVLLSNGPASMSPMFLRQMVLDQPWVPPRPGTQDFPYPQTVTRVTR